MGAIIDQARNFRDAVLQRKAQSISASQLWETSHEEMHVKAIKSIDDEKAFIEFLTENNAFTFPRLNSDPDCGRIVGEYLDYLKRAGVNIGVLPAHIEESPLVGRRTIVQVEGRPLSTMFLLHLCVALRLQKYTSNVKRVLEIGGGYGNLARIMRLFWPDQQYFIIDLLDSLYCSYVFISNNFPHSRILFVTEPSQLKDTKEFDFVFVATEFFDELKGQSFDLVVNTCSLGEMPQSTVDRYMRFLNQEADVRYFYSINRFGPFSAEWVIPDQSNVSMFLDGDWKVLVWDAFGEAGFSQIEPIAPAYLEVLAERDRSIIDKEKVAARLVAMAAKETPNSSAWHYCFWNAIRLWPSQPIIREYLKIIEPLIFRDGVRRQTI